MRALSRTSSSSISKYSNNSNNLTSPRRRRRRRRPHHRPASGPGAVMARARTHARTVNVEAIFYKTAGRALTRGQYRVQCQYQRNRSSGRCHNRVFAHTAAQFLGIRHVFSVRDTRRLNVIIIILYYSQSNRFVVLFVFTLTRSALIYYYFYLCRLYQLTSRPCTRTRGSGSTRPSDR